MQVLPDHPLLCSAVHTHAGLVLKLGSICTSTRACSDYKAMHGARVLQPHVLDLHVNGEQRERHRPDGTCTTLPPD